MCWQAKVRFVSILILGNLCLKHLTAEILKLWLVFYHSYILPELWKQGKHFLFLLKIVYIQLFTSNVYVFY